MALRRLVFANSDFFDSNEGPTVLYDRCWLKTMSDSEGEVQFAISLRPDRDGFLRRSCLACGREFKTEINDADLQWEMASQCRRMGVSIGDESHEDPCHMVLSFPPACPAAPTNANRWKRAGRVKTAPAAS
jgi:hypothetical protein